LTPISICQPKARFLLPSTFFCLPPILQSSFGQQCENCLNVTGAPRTDGTKMIQVGVLIKIQHDPSCGIRSSRRRAGEPNSVHRSVTRASSTGSAAPGHLALMTTRNPARKGKHHENLEYSFRTNEGSRIDWRAQQPLKMSPAISRSRDLGATKTTDKEVQSGKQKLPISSANWIFPAMNSFLGYGEKAWPQSIDGIRYRMDREIIRSR
jgi:hypothetical protein